jgi:hypothetical protein
VVVVLATALALASLTAVALSRPPESRAGLIAGGLPLALLAPVAAATFVAGKLGGEFGTLAGLSPGDPRAAAHASALLWQLQRMAWAAFALACLLGLGLAVVRSSGESAGEAACSARRGFVLLLLPCLALALATAVTLRLAKGVRVNSTVLSLDYGDPASREGHDAALEAHGFAVREPGGLGAVVRYLARTSLIGVYGGATAGLVLLGLAAPGFILAWRVGFGSRFRAVASAIWLLGATLGSLAALGLLEPLRFL